MNRSLSRLLLSATILAPASAGWAQESPTPAAEANLPVLDMPTDGVAVDDGPDAVLDAQAVSSPAGDVVVITPANVASPTSVVQENTTLAEEPPATLDGDGQDALEMPETSMVIMDDPELDAPIRRLATIRLDTREHELGDGDKPHVLTTEFDDFDTAIPVAQVMSSDPTHYPGCTVQRGGTPPSGLIAPPARYVPDDMQIVLKDASGRSYLDGTVPARVEMAEPDVASASPSDLEAVESLDDTEDAFGAADSDTDREARGAERRAQRQAERRAERQAERRAGRRDKTTRLGKTGAWIRLRGRGFRQFGKIMLPSAPALNLRRGEDVAESLGGVLTDPESIELAWDPASMSGGPDVLIDLRLVRSSLVEEAEDTLRVVCRVPDTGRFVPPDELWAAIDPDGYEATRLEVSRRTEETQRIEHSLVRMVRHTTHVIGSD